MKNILFVCGKNKWRSPTAEAVFADLSGVETASAGLDNDAEYVLDPDLVSWADIIFVMEKKHKSKLQSKFKKYINKTKSNLP